MHTIRTQQKDMCMIMAIGNFWTIVYLYNNIVNKFVLRGCLRFIAEKVVKR